jgi:hypothetical protein
MPAWVSFHAEPSRRPNYSRGEVEVDAEALGPVLLVHETGRPVRVARLDGGEHLIGRSSRAHIILPNAGVSRRHARLVREGDQWVVEDLGSANGTRVNGESVKRHALVSGDCILVGKYMLKFTDEGRPGPLPAESADDLLPYHSSVVTAVQDETYEMPGAQARRMAAALQLVGQAWIVSTDGIGGPWRPGDAHLGFGGPGGIPLPRGGSLVAKVHWDSRGHVLRRSSFLVPVLVNGLPVSERLLQPGDRLLVAGRSFEYCVARPASAPSPTLEGSSPPASLPRARGSIPGYQAPPTERRASQRSRGPSAR